MSLNVGSGPRVMASWLGCKIGLLKDFFSDLLDQSYLFFTFLSLSNSYTMHIALQVCADHKTSSNAIKIRLGRGLVLRVYYIGVL